MQSLSDPFHHPITFDPIIIASYLDKGSSQVVDDEPATPCKIHIINPTVIIDIQQLEQAVEEIGNWSTLCKNLNVNKGILDNLKFERDAGTSKKSTCLQAYINSAKASWEEVAIVVAKGPFYNNLQAQDIAKKNLKGENMDKIMKSLKTCSAEDLQIAIDY